VRSFLLAAGPAVGQLLCSTHHVRLCSTLDHWLLYWNASSVLWNDDPLTTGYWYGSQYILGLISRKGAVGKIPPFLPGSPPAGGGWLVWHRVCRVSCVRVC
jgi:hypothetical protein